MKDAKGGDRRPAPRDRFRGALLGLAVGDALGAPAKFMTPEQIVARWGVLADMVGGGCHNVAPGQTTDATDMALCLAESLVAHDDFDPADVVQRYVAWFETAPRDVSLTARTVMLVLASGTPWDLASRRAHEILGFPTAGNGSIMRCAPIALRFYNDRERRVLVSRRESGLTHFGHLAAWSCVAFNELLVAALAGQLEERLPAIAAILDEEDARVAAAVREATVAEPDEIQAAAFVLESLKAALWAVLRCSSFEEALIEIVNRGDDCDTVGAMTGALAGARYGEQAIPARWLQPLEQRARVTAAADALADRADRRDAHMPPDTPPHPHGGSK